MNVILLDKVENLGDIGDLVNVKPGYGRNFPDSDWQGGAGHETKLGRV